MNLQTIGGSTTRFVSLMRVQRSDSERTVRTHGKRFRLHSIGTMVVLLVFGARTGVDSPPDCRKSSHPAGGGWQRINIGVFLLWVVVLATVLLRDAREARPS